MGFPSELVIATHNRGKLAEFELLVRGRGVELHNAPELGLPSPDEPHRTYRANARLKACAAFQRCAVTTIADDTGIEIDALGGRPGVDTADFAEIHGGWNEARVAIANRTGLRLGVVRPRATAICALAVVGPGSQLIEAECRVPGFVVWPPNEALPGFAAMFETAPGLPSFVQDGVLLHRRMAWSRLAAALEG